MHTYITTTIPYVNASPHIGHALELVQADVLARHSRARGGQVRYQAGTDDNALKNVLAAQTAGLDIRSFIDHNGRAFSSLVPALSLSVDDVIRTSSDPRHRPGVQKLWQACAAAGDLYRRQYEGLYCTGCEQFYTEPELDAGLCPEHQAPPERAAEENWFFRLSRYGPAVRSAIASGRLRIVPERKRNEVLAVIGAGLRDFSVSRPAGRARGWGIPVPGDPAQVIYVWWDALGSYITALGYGGDGAEYQRWWGGGTRRAHVLGKGVIRFHAVYWPAILLSAGLPLPDELFVHDYLTAGGRKISKSSDAATVPGPAALADEFGVDALRWWLLREVPRTGDTDFTAARLIARADDELANGIGNLVNRVVAMIHRYRSGRIAGLDRTPLVLRSRADVAAAVDAAVADYDFRSATEAICSLADRANRYVNKTRPWELARARSPGQLGAVLGTLYDACRVIAAELAPFLPDAAARISSQLEPTAGVLPRPGPVFRQLRSVTQDPA